MSSGPEYSVSSNTVVTHDKPVSHAVHITASITGHREVALSHYQMTLAAGAIATTAKAGQFVHVLSRPEAIRDPLLRRAFSIMAVTGDEIKILYRVMGLGTLWLSNRRVGEEIDLIGPLGKPFTPLSGQSILVGGGVGVPPLVMLASTHSPSNPAPGESIAAIVGARSERDLIGIAELKTLNVPVEVSTDDGSAGHHGRVTDLLEVKLNACKDSRPTVYTCGPFAMLRAVAEMCRQYGVPCQISLEENMPCGVGICNGCVVPVIGAGDDYGRYRRICVDGPVAWAHEVDWHHFPASAACY